MTRISKLSTDQEFAIEERRERLRDKRLTRVCKFLLSLAVSIAVASSASPSLLSALLRFV